MARRAWAHPEEQSVELLSVHHPRARLRRGSPAGHPETSVSWFEDHVKEAVSGTFASGRVPCSVMLCGFEFGFG